MPARLEVTDGTITVDLYDKTNNYYALYPLNLNVGDEESDVDEVIDMAYGSARDTTDERALDNNELEGLLLQAGAYWDLDQPQNIAPVYLIHQAVGETDVRYSMVKQGRIATLQSNVGGQRTAASVAILLTREGYWMDIAPFGTLEEFVSATTIGNRMERDIATTDNYVTVSEPAGGQGSALQIEINTVSGDTFRRAIVAKRTGTTAFLDSFEPHFWSNSDYFNDAGGTTLTATADAPDNEAYVTGTTAGTYDPEWRPTLADSQAYVGNFHLMAKARITNATGTATIKMTVNNSHVEETERDIDATDSLIDMGRINLPLTNFPPGWTGTPTGPFRIQMTMITAGGSNVTFYGFWLIPIDEGVFTGLRTNDEFGTGILAGDQMVLDGTREFTYVITSGGALDLIYQVAADGVYLDAPKRGNTRLWVFLDDLDDFDYDINISMRVLGFTRFGTLRGNT